MSVNNATLTVFKTQLDAESAVQQLARNGYDLAKVSMVGRQAGSDPSVGSYVNGNERHAPEADLGAWGGIRRMLVGSGLCLVPGIGPLFVAGPLLTWIVRSMGNVVGLDKVGAMGAGLHELGIPADSILRCEGALRSGKVVLIAEGSAMAMILAREVFRRTPAEVIEQHARLPPAEVDPSAA
jgi:hypothetical protein